MGRHQTSSSFITPHDSTGVDVVAGTASLGRGTFQLVAGTYFFRLGGHDTPYKSCQLQWDATLAGVATIEDTNFSDVLSHSVAVGDWIDEDPTTAFVGTVGAGAAVTNGVLTITAGAQGGALWHIADTAARRTRLKLVVSTPGACRVAEWGKE